MSEENYVYFKIWTNFTASDVSQATNVINLKQNEAQSVRAESAHKGVN